jgi:hypothetical protein
MERRGDRWGRRKDAAAKAKFYVEPNRAEAEQISAATSFRCETKKSLFARITRWLAE